MAGENTEDLVKKTVEDIKHNDFAAAAQDVLKEQKPGQSKAEVDKYFKQVNEQLLKDQVTNKTMDGFSIAGVDNQNHLLVANDKQVKALDGAGKQTDMVMMEGTTTVITHPDKSQVATSSDGHVVAVLTADGRRRNFDNYDAQGNPTTISYDDPSKGFKGKWTKENDGKWHDYDDKGKPTGRVITGEFKVDDKGDISVTDADNKRNWNYTTDGNVLKENPDHSKVGFDSDRNISTVVDATGKHAHTFEYDHGKMIGVTGEDGHYKKTGDNTWQKDDKTTWTGAISADGNGTYTALDAKGGGRTVRGDGAEIQYAVSGNDKPHISVITHPDGSAMSFSTFDADGNPTAVTKTDAAGNKVDYKKDTVSDKWTSSDGKSNWEGKATLDKDGNYAETPKGATEQTIVHADGTQEKKSLDTTAPAATTDKTAPAATTDKTAPAATTDKTAPAATTDKTAPAATTDKTAPAATTDKTAPAATTDTTAPAATTDKTAPAATTDKTAPAATTDKTAPAATTDKTAPAATTDTTAPAATTDTTAPAATTDTTAPAATTDKTAPGVTTTDKKVAQTNDAPIAQAENKPDTKTSPDDSSPLDQPVGQPTDKTPGQTDGAPTAPPENKPDTKASPDDSSPLDQPVGPPAAPKPESKDAPTDGKNKTVENPKDKAQLPEIEIGHGRHVRTMPDGSSEYKVHHGDTVWSVATDVLTNKLGHAPTGREVMNEVGAIAKASKLKDAHWIHEGETLRVPVDQQKPAAATHDAFGGADPLPPLQVSGHETSSARRPALPAHEIHSRHKPPTDPAGAATEAPQAPGPTSVPEQPRVRLNTPIGPGGAGNPDVMVVPPAGAATEAPPAPGLTSVPEQPRVRLNTPIGPGGAGNPDVMVVPPAGTATEAPPALRPNMVPQAPRARGNQQAAPDVDPNQEPPIIIP